MKKLIISSNTYSFLGYTAGMLMSEKSENSLYIVNKDYRKMYNCKYLCKESIFIQRQYDIVNISEGLNFSDINFYTYDSEESLKIQIQLSIAFKNVDEVYYPDWDLLRDIISDISSKFDIKLFSYKPITNAIEVKKYTLSRHVYNKKIDLADKMIGINSRKEIKNLYKPIERFY